MKEKRTKEKTPKDSGFGARLAFAVIFTLSALVCLILAFIFLPIMGGDAEFLVILLFGLAAGFGFYAFLGYVGAFAGVKHKWANVLLIVFTAPLCFSLLGLLAIIGGAVGVKEINNPELAAERRRKRESRNGFDWRLAFAILFTAAAISFIITTVIFALLYAQHGEVYLPLIMLIIFALLSAFCVVFTILGFIGAFAGKKHKWANVLSIVLGSITAFSLFGIPAIVGGLKGLKPWRLAEEEAKAKAQAEKEEWAIMLAEQSAPENSVGETREVAAAEIVEAEKPLPEYIQPKMGKKGKTAIMITLIVSYSLLLLVGILLAAVPSMSNIISKMGICEEISARAYGITIGVMWVTLVPSFGYYFATVSPTTLSKKVKIIISAVCAVLSVVMVVIFFVIINVVKIEGLIAVNKFYEGSDTWFIPVSVVFATLGLMVCHALTLFKINPAKIRNKKPDKCGDGLMSVIKHAFALLIYGIIGLVKFILTCKEKQPDIFILISTILLTWLAHFVSFVFAIICIAVLIGVVIMFFAGVISFAYTPSGPSAEKEYKDEYGNTVNLTEQNYVKDDRYQKVYKDEQGNEYISDDDGKHVRKNEE